MASPGWSCLDLWLFQDYRTAGLLALWNKSECDLTIVPQIFLLTLPEDR